jgi:carbon storage regulator CsrA
VIDGKITVKVIEVQGQRVRLGIEAPQQVRVVREELTAGREPAAA